jgi:hypothetical protein
LKPLPPKICTASVAHLFAWSAANSFAMLASAVLRTPASASHAALCVSRRAASSPAAMSASIKATAWCCAMGLPIVRRSSA